MLGFEPPGSGFWKLHPPAFQRGPREFPRSWGMLIEALELALVNGLADRRVTPLAEPRRLLLRFRRGGGGLLPIGFVNGTPGLIARDLPAVALPVAVAGGGMPVGLEIQGATGRDEELIALASVQEARRGTLPAPRAWQSRRGEAPGDLEAARFRALTRALTAALQRRSPLPAPKRPEPAGDGGGSLAKPPPAASP